MYCSPREEFDYTLIPRSMEVFIALQLLLGFFFSIEWKLCSGVRETANHIWKSNVYNQRWWNQHSWCSYSCSANTCKINLSLTFTFRFPFWPPFLVWRALIFFLLLQVAAAGSEENENFENPVYSSVICTSPKETTQNTDVPQVGNRNALRLLVFCSRSEKWNC